MLTTVCFRRSRHGQIPKRVFALRLTEENLDFALDWTKSCNGFVTRGFDGERRLAVMWPGQVRHEIPFGDWVMSSATGFYWGVPDDVFHEDYEPYPA